MSETMRPLAFAELMEMILGEYRQSQSIFGIRKDKFYRNDSKARMSRYGVDIDSPIGPAAGPNSQLAENIVAAYLAGSRFIELKTVQTLDGSELAACVPRPCINATDECYNVEWSTELTVQQAFEEYVKAWVACHLLGMEHGLGCGLVFNMSVGYSLEGVQSEKIDGYLNNMRNAASSAIWRECLAWASANLQRFTNLTAADLQTIPAKISDSVTLSTLHGCPADEIERIAHHLLVGKGFHTSIKCNPTLLGYAEARRLLDEMGFKYVSFDAHHFLEDLQFADAQAMILRLQAEADRLGLDFGVKVTNTFPVDIKHGELPGEEMYMSGRALFSLSLNVAKRLAQATDGKLQISYSGGADAFNLAHLLVTGIRPVTMATTLLKPGGYERLSQLAAIAEGHTDPQVTRVNVAALESLAASLGSWRRYHKEYRSAGSRKGIGALKLFDCGAAPCSASGCPINQKIPAYMEKVAAHQMQQAFEVIVNDNVLPAVTGTICDHQCQAYCTRLDYDESLQIRQAKKAAVLAAEADWSASHSAPALRTDKKVLVIGAGPAGIAAASYLRRNGVAAYVREQRSQALGIVAAVIPEFRISQADLHLDLDLAVANGVSFEFNSDADYDLGKLRQEFDYVIIATGAWKQGRSDIPVDGQRVIDALDFLERSKASGLTLELGSTVAVIGGGDVAMDCARAAARNQGVAQASLVYRRTMAEMPAQPEELRLALADGVQVVELRAPVSFADGVLTCDIMELGAADSSGRASVAASGSREELRFDTVISAVGASVDTALFEKNGLALGDRGLPQLSANNLSSLAGVYVIGDCKAGPKTVVQAMADAKAAASDILDELDLTPDFVDYQSAASREQLIAKKAVLLDAKHGDQAVGLDAERCLGCDTVCEICVDVCPNRANVSIDLGADPAPLTKRHQILHLDGLCNECGNCAVFCPSAEKPYINKLTLFATVEDFQDSQDNRGLLPLGDGRYRLRLEDGRLVEGGIDSAELPVDIRKLLAAVDGRYAYLKRGCN
ncbi:MAG: putative selenate reductase subunit YgfK [Actinomycetia bacterium]|nr:putative selenate reductase subunit YgfK [Actinomycetes bacterium]